MTKITPIIMSKLAPPKPKKPAPPPLKPSAKKPAKQFTIAAWDGINNGEKIILYGLTGKGKTSLCRLLPNAVFIGVDPGGSKVRKLDGSLLDFVPGIECFEDMRAALHSNVFDSCDNIVVETITDVEQWGLKHTLDTVPKPKSQGGSKAIHVHDYGYHKGFTHWMNTMLLLLPDFDRWIHRGKNVILTAQEATIKWKTSGVEDFLMAGPELHHSTTASTLLAYLRWADHVFRIDYANIPVEDGRAQPVNERAIFVKGDATFFAKSRGDRISEEYDSVEFKNPDDDSIWRLLFNENNSINTK